MSVRREDDVVFLEGACGVEEAELLLGFLQAGPMPTVDLSGAEHIHTAVLQILLATAPPLRGQSQDAFVREWLMPILL
jgi:hypothetical protein